MTSCCQYGRLRLLWLLRVIILLCAGASFCAAGEFNVRDFGGKGDGQNLDSPAINRAIAAAAAVGGGTVRFPAGIYLSYSIRLQSRITLHLESGAVLLAAEPKSSSEGYDRVEKADSDLFQDFGHTYFHNSLIWGENLEQVAIVGFGRIDGRGLSKGKGLRDPLPIERASGIKEIPVPWEFPAPSTQAGAFGYPSVRDYLPVGVGNKAIALKNCRQVTIRDLTIFHGGHFAVLATGVEQMSIDNVIVDTNRDGFDIDSCNHVRISNCVINSPYDDAICLKTSFALGKARALENCTIVNCQVSGYDEGTMLDGTYGRTMKKEGIPGPTGRIKIGTETNGDFRNIAISNCAFSYCRGLALETVDGGCIENVNISNLVMQDIVNAPIFVRLGTRQRAPAGTPPGAIRGVKISQVTASKVSSESGILISGVSGARIEDLSLSDIAIEFAGGGTKEQSERLVAAMDRDYPEPYNFGVMPAWGLFARYVDRLHVSHLKLSTSIPDYRTAISLQDVGGAFFTDSEIGTARPASTFKMKNVGRFLLRADENLPDESLREVGSLSLPADK